MSFTLIAGPCVLEDNASVSQRIALQIYDILPPSENIDFFFKGSFDKANRTNGESYRGVGLDKGLEQLLRIKEQFGFQVTTDVHECWQVNKVAEVCDMIQIPAMLSRQTDLIKAAAATGKKVNIKKSQMMNGVQAYCAFKKADKEKTYLTERGTMYGYDRLITDFHELQWLREMGVPVIFDATHSVQRPPSNLLGQSGGNKKLVFPLCKAVLAFGIDGLFLETHYEPSRSPSDSGSIINLNTFSDIVDELAMQGYLD